MASASLKSLTAHLGDVPRRALQGAAALCQSRTHFNIEIEHWLLKLLETRGSDLEGILRRFEIDKGRLVTDMTRAVDRFQTGNARAPGIAPDLHDALREAWLVASLEFDVSRARSGHVLIGLRSSDVLWRKLLDTSREFELVSRDVLIKEFDTITSSSLEADEASAGGPSTAAIGPDGTPRGSGKSPNLDQFTVDLTRKARDGKIDPVLGRDPEIRQVIDILTRRRQNNPILTGEAGVGKTAVAEGFALRIAQGEVPPALQNVEVRTLDLALLQAGAGVKGEFENRLKGVIEEVKGSPKPIILFIDEAHTMIGAGGQAGQGDAANLLKPALARGELRTIAATTWAEYKKYFERDAALARRFQVVKVEEPEEKTAIEIMRGLVALMEKHHKVRVMSDAVVESVRLSSRYISGRQLPDKSVSLLDTACARVALSQGSVPAPIEDARRRIEQFDVGLGILRREVALRPGLRERIEELEAERVRTQSELAALEVRWKRELAMVQEVQALRSELEGGGKSGGVPTASPTAAAAAATAAPTAASSVALPPAGAAATAEPAAKAGPVDPVERERLVARIRTRTAELKELQGQQPLVHECVDAQAIAEVVANWTGIPVGRMMTDQIRTVLNLRSTLEERIVGQSNALEALAQSIRTSRANLTDPKKPIGVFLLVGTSGVGKTETAVALSDLLYGGEQNMTVINMSEFKEEHKVSLLMGSPPGYVGYGEGGVLTEAVRRKPYSVLLLDELEKAHPGIQDVFYQVFDKGTMKDGEGRDIDFRNTVILMTTNAGTDTIMSLCKDPETIPSAAGLRDALYPDLLKTFKPAFLGRLTILPYFPLTDAVLGKIVALKLTKVASRIRENHRASLEWGPEVVQAILGRCKEVESGARNIDNILNRTLLPELAGEFLAAMADGKTIEAATVGVDSEGRFTYGLRSR
jgi:type VI secretion system protein VasG